ncbi:hypothetical protein TNCV_2199171 [Trichonephila clavipes]|nr:hypothetical protein TNCV_2199171 [Trichonephila clavipes]
MHLPPNLTTLMQPMDQGVIKKLKRIYRRQVLRRLLSAENDEESVAAFAENLNMKDTCYIRSQNFKNAMKKMYKPGWHAMQKDGFQMLNDDKIVTSVQEESDPVDDKTDEDEDNSNNKSSKGPTNADIAAKKRRCTMCPVSYTAWIALSFRLSEQSRIRTVSGPKSSAEKDSNIQNKALEDGQSVMQLLDKIVSNDTDRDNEVSMAHKEIQNAFVDDPEVPPLI